MKPLHIALLGFGTVGQGIYRSIYKHQDRLRAHFGRPVRVVAIVVRQPHIERRVHEGVLVTHDLERVLKERDVDVVMEAIVGEEPAYTYLKRAIEHGCHVVTANKVMFAPKGRALRTLAEEKGVYVGYEASVAGGIPVMRTLRELLRVNEVIELEGILNGTSNFILSEMRTNGSSFTSVLREAQEKGYAEADPTNDVEGYDAFYKLMILSETVFGEQPVWSQVEREGITKIDAEQHELAATLGLRLRHVGKLSPTQTGIQGEVVVSAIFEDHPFYGIDGVDNAVRVQGSLVGSLLLRGPGAGGDPTASAMVEDLTNVLQLPKDAVPSPPVPKENKVETARPYALFLPHGPSLPAPYLRSGTLVPKAEGEQWKLYVLYATPAGAEEWKSALPFTRLYPILGGFEKEAARVDGRVPAANALVF